MKKIRAVEINDCNSLSGLLAEFFPNLPDTLYLADVRTRKLYLSTGLELYSVHNPYSGEQIRFDEGLDLQEVIGHRNVWLYQSLHTVFLEPDGRLVDREGIELETRPCPKPSWSRAIVESAFK